MSLPSRRLVHPPRPPLFFIIQSRSQARRERRAGDSGFDNSLLFTLITDRGEPYLIKVLSMLVSVVDAALID
jgi:hypothetical protein